MNSSFQETGTFEFILDESAETTAMVDRSGSKLSSLSVDEKSILFYNVVLKTIEGENGVQVSISNQGNIRINNPQSRPSSAGKNLVSITDQLSLKVFFALFVEFAQRQEET